MRADRDRENSEEAEKRSIHGDPRVRKFRFQNSEFRLKSDFRLIAD
jgi:hypothetical protein